MMPATTPRALANVRQPLATLDVLVEALAREAERLRAERRRLDVELQAARAVRERSDGSVTPTAEEPTALADGASRPS